MDPNIFKTLHLLGIFLLFLSLGGLTMTAFASGERPPKKVRAVASASHGIAMLIIVVAGFGLLGKNAWPMPGWAAAKLAIWVVFGAALVIPLRLPKAALPLFFLLPVIGAVSAWLALAKPF